MSSYYKQKPNRLAVERGLNFYNKGFGKIPWIGWHDKPLDQVGMVIYLNNSVSSR